MITGFNTDIDFDGRVFHVQTEDRGLANPIVESLVYTGGEIVTSRKSSYADLIEAGYDESELLHRMESQHRDLIRAIRNGEFSPGGLMPFGHGVVTNRSFDEVVRGFLEENFGLEGLAVRLVAPGSLLAGERPKLELLVTDAAGARPVAGASVIVRLAFGGRGETELLSLRTDAEGRAETAFEVPDRPGSAAVVFEAEAAGRTTRLECPVHARGAAGASA